MRPSFIYHQIHAVLEIVVFLFIIYYFYSRWNDISLKNTIFILSLVSIICGIHAILHYFEEIYYDFNPLIGKSKVNDNPISRY